MTITMMGDRDIPPADRASVVYRGPGGMRALAPRLQAMVHEGTEVSRGQRDRWIENRAFYRGDQWIEHHPGTGASRVLTAAQQAAHPRRRDTINRLRPFTDGRLALYATERPPFTIVPPNRTQEAADGAHQAQALVEAMWGEDGWNIKSRIPELARAGEIDGVAFLCVEWDATKGPETNIPLIEDATGRPVTDPAQVEALRQEDPGGGTLWRQVMPPGPMGDVAFRVVRAGAMSVDPIAVSDFSDAWWCCESRVISRAQAERLAGRPWVQIVKSSDSVLGINRDYSAITGHGTDDGTTNPSSRARDAVTVNMLYHRPGGDFPRGLRCVWFDQAAGDPVVMDPWNDELPYRPFCPKPDGGSFFACRGTVDDLKPIQRRFNRLLSAVGEWLDRVAMTPLAVPRGSLAGQSVYNDRGYFEVNPGLGEPRWMSTPPEPVAILSQHLAWTVNEMAAVSAQTEAVRGEVAGSREAASSIQLRIHQSEQQLAGSTAELVGIYEWGVSRALRLVARNWVLPRAVVSPGAGDSLEMGAFTGQMLGGAHRFKVTGSIQPATRAAEMQALMQFAPIIGADIRPHVAGLLGGDTSGFKRADEAQRRRAERRNRAIAALASDERALAVHSNFAADTARYAKALAVAAEEAQEQPPPPELPGPDGQPIPLALPRSPQDILSEQGIAPPRLLDALGRAGVQVPGVEPQDDPIQQLGVMRTWMVGEAFERMHPVVHQAARETSDLLVARMAEQLQASGAQDPSAPGPGQSPQGGSPPAPKGEASQPRQPGQPAGTPPMRAPGG